MRPRKRGSRGPASQGHRIDSRKVKPQFHTAHLPPATLRDPTAWLGKRAPLCPTGTRAEWWPPGLRSPANLRGDSDRCSGRCHVCLTCTGCLRLVLAHYGCRRAARFAPRPSPEIHGTTRLTPAGSVLECSGEFVTNITKSIGLPRPQTGLVRNFTIQAGAAGVGVLSTCRAEPLLKAAWTGPAIGNTRIDRPRASWTRARRGAGERRDV